MSRAVLFWLALLLLVSGGTIVVLALRAKPNWQSGSQGEVDLSYLNSPDYRDIAWMQDFTLTERSGRKVRSEDLKGKPYIASFFYTSCPAECLQQNAKLGELAREFRESDFVFLSISCDPETDTPSRLRQYANQLHVDSDNWLFLTGELNYLKRISAEMFGVPLDKQAHTERFIAVDRAGIVRKQFGWKQPAQMTELRMLMKKMLDESPEAAASDQDKTNASVQEETAPESAESSAE